MVPRELKSSQPIEELLENALDQPVGADPLEKWATRTARVLLLVDDITRQTPAWALLPGIFRRLERAGVTRANIRILIAAGTHSHMTQEELGRKLGAETLEQYPVLLHHWMVSDGIPRDVQRRIGFEPAGSPLEALRMAFALAGQTAKVAVLQQGGHVLPLSARNSLPAGASRGRINLAQGEARGEAL